MKQTILTTSLFMLSLFTIISFVPKIHNEQLVVKPLIENDSLYGFYSMLIDTVKTMSGEFKRVDVKYLDLYQPQASYLIPENSNAKDSIKVMDETSSSIVIVDTDYDNLLEYVKATSEEELFIYAKDNFRPILTDEGIVKNYELAVLRSYEVQPKQNSSVAKKQNSSVAKKQNSKMSDGKNEVHILDLISDDDMVKFLTVNNNLHNYSFYAKQRNYPPSVFIAMGALESRYGKSSLVKGTKNYGNIKCACNRNKSLGREHRKYDDTDTPFCKKAYDKIEKSNDYYVVYPTNWEGIRKKFLILDKYRVMKNLPINPNSYQVVTAIHKSPYATDKNYDDKIFSIMKKGNLQAIDKAIKEGKNIICGNTKKYVILNQKLMPN